TVALGTNRDRFADAPATALKKISSVMWVITWTDCCRATAVALQQSVQVITHITLLIFFSAVAGASANLSRFVPSATV
ncbi:hypothetical protein C6A85_05955, partial [Mycobacterium sp. ITM-2017-0098]